MARRAPCLSLYQRTHRHGPENLQDPIRFRNHVKELEASLLKNHPKDEVRSLLKPFDALALDSDFWNHTLDGLAVLGASDFFRVIRLTRPVVDLVVVADRFHTKPLSHFLQSVDRYQILALSLDKIRLFEGDRDSLEEVELAADVPRTMNDALGSELSEPHQTVASYGGVGAASSPMHHGHGGKSDEVDNDATRYFRAVAHAVLEHHSRPSGLPLILAALPEHHHRFRSAGHNPFLLAEGITINPHAITPDMLRAHAWQVVEPYYKARLAKLNEDFAQARASGRGSDDLPEITAATASGRVATLFIGADRPIAAHFDDTTDIAAGVAQGQPRVNDELDDLSELVGKMGGDVLVLPGASMPTQTGVAAIYRY